MYQYVANIYIYIYVPKEVPCKYGCGSNKISGLGYGYAGLGLCFHPRGAKMGSTF